MMPSSSRRLLCRALALALLVTLGAPAARAAFPPAPAAEQLEAVQGVVARLFAPRGGPPAGLELAVSPSAGCPGRSPAQAAAGLGCFTLSAPAPGRVRVEGTSAVDVAFGVHWYLKRHANGTASWPRTGGNELGALASPGAALPPAPAEPLTVVRAARWSYYANVCTHSYGFAWFSWERWERELDWMALQGVNLPLAFTGQEAVWAGVYRALNVTDAELGEHFGGPAFLAWARMGNLRGWGGPLPPSWMDAQLGLQQRIVARMRLLGMTPVLPGFAGHVPEAVARLYPRANVTRLPSWAGFPPALGETFLLDPADPLFRTIGAAFVRAQARVYGGTSSFYSADTWNEMEPRSGDPAYLARASAGVLGGMRAADPAATWVMQGWLFRDTPRGFWTAPRIEALLGGVPDDAMIVLDLEAAARPVWSRTRAFYGKPFIFCVLSNFGGNNNMYGTMPAVAASPPAALRKAGAAGMVGVGMTPEGIDQNVVVYDLAAEMAWRADAPDLGAWYARYAVRRYGAAHPGAAAAWAALARTVYDCTDGHENHNRDVVVARPALAYGPPGTGTYGLHPYLWYNTTEVALAWRGLLSAAPALNASAAYRHDLVDLGRQVLTKRATVPYQALAAAQNRSDAAGFAAAASELLELLDDMERLLRTAPGFLLGPWLRDAAATVPAGAPAGVAALVEWNARRQLTLWGQSSPPTPLHDYANKEWSGMVGGFYAGRWRLFAREVQASLAPGAAPFNATAWAGRSTAYAEEWCNSTAPFPLDTLGDPAAVSCALYSKYAARLGVPPAPGC